MKVFIAIFILFIGLFNTYGITSILKNSKSESNILKKPSLINLANNIDLKKNNEIIEITFFNSKIPLPPLATVSTTTASSILSTSATSGGVASGSFITSRGVCWSTSANPTKLDSKTSNGTGTGTFSSSITGLIPGTTYHYRAYVTNPAGTNYGTDLTFTTLDLPTLTTTAASSILINSASSGGNITSDGGASVTEKGVCWSTSINPTIGDSKTSDGTGTGSFSSSITSLSSGTIYHIRAFATNSVGTSYGSDLTFNTPFTFISTTSGNWITAGSWVNNTVPTSSDFVQVNNSHNITVSSSTSITDLILKSGSTVTVSATTVLTITGNLQDEGGNFAIDSGAQVVVMGNVNNSSVSSKLVNTSTNGLIIKGNVDVGQ